MNHTTLRGLIVGPPGMPIPVIQTEGGKWSAARPLTDEEAAWMRTHKDRADIDILNYEDKPCCRLVDEKLSEEYVEATYPRMILPNVEAKTEFWRNSWRGGKNQFFRNIYSYNCPPPKEPTNMNQAQDVQPHWPPLPHSNNDMARGQFIQRLLHPNVVEQGNKSDVTRIRPFEQELMREAIDMVVTIIGKNRDYGASVAKPPLLAPHLPAGVGIDVRLSDKIERLISLSNGSIANVKDESIEDTKLDMAAYVLLQRVVRKMQPQQGQSCPPPSNATSVEKT